MRVFLIDDEKMYYKMLQPVLKKAGHILGYANSGEEGLRKIAIFDPDVIILDIRMPDISGFDVLERLRVDAHFSHVPVIFATSFDELESKLKAFDLGAEDYITKPFRPEELLARLVILARRREYLKAAENITQVGTNPATVVALHSLRGGVGCTSLAVNLAIAYNQLWQRPTMLVDSVLTSGQGALFLNASPKSTWTGIANKSGNDLDDGLIRELVNTHKSGIHYVASPLLPTSFESLCDTYPKILGEFCNQHDFIVVDTPHDFSDVAVMSLDVADTILLMLAPEMGSFRAAICALRTYDNLGYPQEKIKIVLNANSPAVGLKTQQIEKAIDRQVDFELPYSQAVFQAINTGCPFVTEDQNLPISMRVQEMAYKLSRDVLKNIAPAVPTPAWENVTKRLRTNR